MKNIALLVALVVFPQYTNGKTMTADPSKTLNSINSHIRNTAEVISRLKADSRALIIAEGCTHPISKPAKSCADIVGKIKMEKAGSYRENKKILHEHCEILKAHVEEFKDTYTEDVILSMPELINPAACATEPSK